MFVELNRLFLNHRGLAIMFDIAALILLLDAPSSSTYQSEVVKVADINVLATFDVLLNFFI